MRGVLYYVTKAALQARGRSARSRRFCLHRLGVTRLRGGRPGPLDQGAFRGRVRLREEHRRHVAQTDERRAERRGAPGDLFEGHGRDGRNAADEAL